MNILKQSRNNVHGNFFVAVAIASVFVATSISSAYAAAYCITNPDGNPPENGFDNRCPVTASISPSASSVASGESVNIIMYANTLYQWWINGIVAAEATMTDAVTGSATTLSNGPGYITGTWSQSVSSGALTHSVLLDIWAESDQGVVDSDSSYVTVNTPSTPSVDIQFSFINKTRTYVSNVIDKISS